MIGRIPGSREPNGLLEETARLGIMRQTQDIGVMDAYRMIKSAALEYAARGVTTAQSGWASKKIATGLSVFSRLGVYPSGWWCFPPKLNLARLCSMAITSPATTVRTGWSWAR